MQTTKCSGAGALHSTELTDEKQSLKESINKVVYAAVESVDIREVYFLTFHAKFNKLNPSEFVISQMLATFKLPPFTSNTMVFYVDPRRGFIELLWMVPPKDKNGKLSVEFNNEGVAYLQLKGAIPS